MDTIHDHSSQHMIYKHGFVDFVVSNNYKDIIFKILFEMKAKLARESMEQGDGDYFMLKIQIKKYVRSFIKIIYLLFSKEYKNIFS